MRVNLIAFFALMISVGAPVPAGDKGPFREYKIRVDQFAILSEKESDTASEQILRVHADMTGGLIGQLQQEKVPDEARVYLIYLLGELRDVRAVSSFIKFIDLKAPRIDPRIRKPRWGDYPAAEALTKIGTQSVRILVLRLAEEQTKLRRQLMVTVIWEVEGEKAGRATLEVALTQQTNDAARTNMRASLEAFDALKADPKPIQRIRAGL